MEEHFEKGEYMYHVTIYREVLANREQEYLRHKKDTDYGSDFCEEDDPDCRRWIKDITTSFQEETLEDAIKHIQSEYNNGRGKKQLIQDGEFIYFIDTNCFINNQKLLHRDRIWIEHSAVINVEEKELSNIVNI